MSAGSDVMDLVGGFKPVDCKILIRELLTQFELMFRRFNKKDNEKFYNSLWKGYRE